MGLRARFRSSLIRFRVSSLSMGIVVTVGVWLSTTLGMMRPTPSFGFQSSLEKIRHCWMMSLARSSPAMRSASARVKSSDWMQYRREV